jgi:hypothetical protein
MYFVWGALDCIDMLVQLHCFLEKMIEWNDVSDLMMVPVDCFLE